LDGHITHHTFDFGRHDDVVAPTLERRPDDLFRLSGGVRRSGVDDVDSAIHSPVNYFDALAMLGVAHRTEHHGAQGVWADLDAGSA